MSEDQNLSVFAGRYRFEPVGDDWDSGRSGNTDLVYDLIEKKQAVIKRVDSVSKKRHHDLRNEIDALLLLGGKGVPKLYESNHTIYSSIEYEYISIEFIEGMRVEHNLNDLTIIERMEIITQLFSILSNAHQIGIANGDVDLKHLFWNIEKRKLTLIDWGNAKIGIDPHKKSEFAFDLARTAEIIYTLVSSKGIPSPVGSISLPGTDGLISGLPALPIEFHNLCKWAPRTPVARIHAPYSTQELHEVSKNWLEALKKYKKYEGKRANNRFGISVTLLILIAAVIALLAFIVASAFQPDLTPTPIIESSQDSPSEVSATATPSLEVLTKTPELTYTPTLLTTSIPGVIPLEAYSHILMFDKSIDRDVTQCLSNTGTSALLPNEGLYRRTDINWGFEVSYDRPVDEIVQVGFSGCAEGRDIRAIAATVLVNRLEIPEFLPSREIGVFVENADGRRREYTLWLEKSNAMYLRIREDGIEILNNPILVVSAENLRFGGEFPRKYSRFPIQIFLEIDNKGMDVIYLLESSFNVLDINAIDPAQMIRIDSSVLPTIGDVEEIGLIGRGGRTEALIGQLVLFER